MLPSPAENRPPSVAKHKDLRSVGSRLAIREKLRPRATRSGGRHPYPFKRRYVGHLIVVDGLD